MFSKARLITSLFLLFFLSAPFVEAKTFDWQAKRHASRTYVPLDRVKEFYGYSLVTSGRKILLTNKGKVAKKKNHHHPVQPRGPGGHYEWGEIHF